MNEEDSVDLTDKERLLFGAGFVFGVMCMLVLLAVVTATLVQPGGGLLASDILVTIFGGVVFAAIIAVSLYLLAFPANRLHVPVEELFDTSESELLGVEDEDGSDDG